MILYHGSDREIVKPDILHSRKEVDFGAGFYTTPIEDQAKNWCKKFIRRGKRGIVSVYNIDETAFKRYRTQKFGTYSDEWLDFISRCRTGKDLSDYDIVIGGVANDRVFDTVELYFENLISRSEAIGRLVMKKPNMQICFRRQEIIDRYLKFERSYRV